MASPGTAIPLRKPGERTKCVIAIDFGTTYSGIGWALEGTSLDDEIEILQEWPSGGNTNAQKAPTVISYHSNGIRWGYQINDLEEAIRGIKLLLDETKAPQYVPSIKSKRLLEAQGKKPVDAAGDYLMKIFHHAKNILVKRGLGTLLETWDVHYILTVPAVWSDKAKDLTKKAAHLAGIPKSNLCLLSEPEAAAVYAIRTIQPNSIDTNDSFIVCDAGGGTVDLITYRVTQFGPMRLAEVTEGTGAMCGSVFLDQRFQDLVIELAGKQNWDTLTKEAKQVTLSRWRETVKTHYEGPETSEDFLDTGAYIPLPGAVDVPENMIENGMFYMENAQIQEIFDPSIKEIEDLISAQQAGAKKAGYPPKAIILVGGFGSSKYLFKRLESRFSGIRIMQPQNAWSAIIRGAVHRGLEGNQVENRKARCHYGVEYSTTFDPLIHEGQASYWCKYQEKQKVRHQMMWYIEKGHSISEQEPIKFPFYRTVPLDSEFVFYDDLCMSVEEDAPGTRTKSVKRLCEVESDLSKIPKELFQKRENSSGVEYYKVIFDLVVTPQSASLLFEVEFNSVCYGKARANYY